MLHDLTLIIPTRSLTTAEIREAAKDLLDVSISNELKATFLSAWARRGESAEELAACAEAFLPQAIDPGVRGTWNGKPLLDCCGTGGGGLNLFNVSTGMMFILAALGIPVVKHGNRGITKKSGSADVLKAFGIKINLSPQQMQTCLDKIGCAFLFAPEYHPSFSAVAEARKMLAAPPFSLRTVFNLLGPLLNPARPDARIVGVFQHKHVELYSETLEKIGCPRFSIAYGQDAASGTVLGEVSANGSTYLGTRLPPATAIAYEWQQQQSPETQPLETLFVQSAEESARRIAAILFRNERGLGRDLLLINAAVAAWTHGTASSVEEGLTMSTEALDSGKALERLKLWQALSSRL